MDELIRWLTTNNTASTIFIILLALLTGVLVIVVLVSLYQGRELVLWGLHIGAYTSSARHHKENRKSNDIGSVDVFLSSPMAAYADDTEYQKDREHVLQISKVLRSACGYETFYAGRPIYSISDFELEDLSIKQDFEALKASKYFVLLYPKKIASSVLVEAGWALAWGKPSIYFVTNRSDLPFLLQYAEQAFPCVRIYDHSTTESIIKLIEHHRTQLFQFPALATAEDAKV